MPLRDTAPVGAPCWVDLFTSDTQRAIDFYSAILGWVALPANDEFGGYFNFTRDGHLVAGCMRNDGSTGAPDAWSVYLATDDAIATADAAATHGAQILVPTMAVGDLGSMALLADVGGAAIGMWQPGLHKGFGVLGEPGSPCWFELHTRDYDASVQFYREVFHWDAHAMSDTADFRYTTLGIGDDALAGIMDSAAFLPAGVSASWQVYFGVDNVDAAMATTVELGGSILQAAEDTPYGRLAQVSDPMGGVFKLMTRG
jgi:uncharacterized protein